MRRSVVIFCVGALLATGAYFVPWASAGAAGQSDLAGLRHATAKYHNIGTTLRSGRSDLHLCVDHMGQHYADTRAFSDGVLNALDPEAMVYADDGAGHLRLVAVEWVSTTPGEVMGITLHLNPALGV